VLCGHVEQLLSKWVRGISDVKDVDPYQY